MSSATMILDARDAGLEAMPLTATKPKALLSIFNKTLIEHAVDNLCHGENVIILVEESYLHLFEKLPLLESCVISCDATLLTEDSTIVDGYYHHDGSYFKILYSWDVVSCAERYGSEAFEAVIADGVIIEEGVTIKGCVAIAQGTTLRSGTYIDGDIIIGSGCQIGPNCYIRGCSSIGDNCRIGCSVELKSVIVGNDVNICHLSYLGDSVVGDDVNIGAGCITSNLRHDKGMITTKLQGVRLSTGRRKLGAVIGDGARLAIRTSIYPGRRIWSGIATIPGDIVVKDLEK